MPKTFQYEVYLWKNTIIRSKVRLKAGVKKRVTLWLLHYIYTCSHINERCMVHKDWQLTTEVRRMICTFQHSLIKNNLHIKVKHPQYIITLCASLGMVLTITWLYLKHEWKQKTIKLYDNMYSKVCRHLSSHVKLWDMEIIYKQQTNKMHIFFKINTHSNLCGFSNANELKKNAHIKKI